MQSFPDSKHEFILPGAEQQAIEVLTQIPEINHPKGTVIVCHPHPLYGGTMHNKVVHTVAKSFQDVGFRTLRFNFRGVGLSAGQHDRGIGELQDLLVLVDWVKRVCPNEPIALAGFSFGAYIAFRAAVDVLREELSVLVSVAPPVRYFDLSSEGSIRVDCPWVVIQGDADEIVAPETVFDWIEQQNPRPIVIRVAETGHFFHGRLGELKARLIQELQVITST